MNSLIIDINDVNTQNELYGTQEGFSPLGARLTKIFNGQGPFLPEPGAAIRPGGIEIMVIIDPVWKGLCSFWLDLCAEEGRLLQRAYESRLVLPRYRSAQEDRVAVGRLMWRILDEKFRDVLNESREKHRWQKIGVRQGWVVVGCDIAPLIVAVPA